MREVDGFEMAGHRGETKVLPDLLTDGGSLAAVFFQCVQRRDMAELVEWLGRCVSGSFA